MRIQKILLIFLTRLSWKLSVYGCNTPHLSPMQGNNKLINLSIRNKECDGITGNLGQNKGN